MTDRSRAHVIVTGRVQGVGFRYELRGRALALGVGGWVRNRLDGSVEAELEAVRERVESLLRWCRQGPRLAHVDEIEIEWQEPTGEHEFRIR